MTFIPPTFLLFNVDRSNKLIENREYKKVTTQDGVELYILKENVSTNNIFDQLGKISVIFNSKKCICRTETGCTKENVDEVLEIHPGNVFKKSEEGGKIKLSGMRNGEKIAGVVSKSDLEKWNKQGIVTFADRPQPRLKITRKDGKYFDLKCDERQEKEKEDSISMEDWNDVDRDINEKLGLADTTETTENNDNISLKFKVSYGEKNSSYKFRTYTVEQKDDEGEYNVEKTYIAQVIYECSTTGVVHKTERIRSVALTLKGDSKKDIILEPWGTPKDLQSLTHTPHYLYSVNDADQYFGLMSKLSKEFGNRAESSYFLAEFNRSCNSSNRDKKKCNTHQYKNIKKSKECE